ncbi:MAG: protein kinase [Polyangiaceae bacterium]|nr:protein kinase [Polyangiaceae bacterium]
MFEPQVTLQPEYLAHFKIVRRLGFGGMAEVFLAEKRGAENTVKQLVLKRVLPAYGSSSRFRALFAEEANLATRLNHPNIVQVYEFQDFAEEGQLLSMEYVEGLDLGKLMTSARMKRTRIPPWVAAYVVAEAAKGLHYAHERRDDKMVPLAIVHRDVSPQNILLSYEGAVKIADFGVATANLFRDEVGVLKGKIGYMSPEQARGEKVDRRSDIFALGVILHEMLTGRPLHPGLRGDDLLEAVISAPIEPPSTFVRDVPPELEAVAMRAMSRQKEDRHQSARDMAGAIARAMMQRQQMVDAVALEATITALSAREFPLPSGEANGSQVDSLDGLNTDGLNNDGLNTDGANTDGQSDDGFNRDHRYRNGRERDSRNNDGANNAPQFTVAATRRSRENSSAGGGVSTADSGKPLASRVIARFAKEVRHVAILTIRLHGLDEIRRLGRAGQAAYVENDILMMLDQLAFKHGARFKWTSQNQARTIVGLTANPSRAAFESAALAIDIREFLKSSGEDWPAKVHASVGVVRGIASGFRDVHGHLINHELQSPAEYLANIVGERAPAGSIWVAGGICRLVRDDFVWQDAHTIHITDAPSLNAPSSMRIYELVRPLSEEERAANRAANPSDLIGRDAERADLHSALHTTTQPLDAAPRQLVARVIVGEMGIGKSALVNAFLSDIEDSSSQFRIDCSPAQSELPLGSIAELIRSITATSTDMSLDQAHKVVCEALGSPVSNNPVAYRLAELASGKQLEHHEDQDNAYVRKMVSSGLRIMLSIKAKERAAVVVIDGLQWTDQSSLEVIAELLRDPDLFPLLVLLVTRPDDRVHPFIENLVHIELRGLRPDEMVRLVEGRLGVGHGVASACADLIPRVAGNPFFLLEMVDALLERGTLEIRQHDGDQSLVRLSESPTTAQELPSTLGQLIADRLAELPSEERSVVHWLAVAGGPLTETDIVSLGGLALEHPIGRLCARGMCDRRNNAIDFRHPIARDVAYKAICERDLVLLHRRLGEHLTESPIASGLSAVIVARHLEKGKLPSQAADYFLEAAQAARVGYQTQLATRYYQRSLRLLPHNDLRRLRAHEALEATFRLLGRHRDRRRNLLALRRLARKSGSAEWIALALMRTAVYYFDDAFFSNCIAVSQQACEAAKVAGAPYIEVEALSTMGEALRELGDIQGALAACDRALELSKGQSVSPRIRADVLRSRGLLLRRVGRVREAVDCHVEAIAVFRQVGARRPEARTTNALAYAMFVLERFEDSIALALTSIGIDLAIGGRFQLAKTLSNIGQAYARLGDLPRGIAYLQRAREAHERYGDQDSRADTLLVSAEVMLEAGDRDAARSFCLDAVALTSVTGSAYDEVHEKIVHAELDRMTGDPNAAVSAASLARQAAEKQALVSFYCLATAVEAAARVDIGEVHTGILLATTALGSVATIQGSEYGLEICYHCWDTLRRAKSPQAREANQVAIARVSHIASNIRDQRLKSLFLSRAMVRTMLEWAIEDRAASQKNAQSSTEPRPVGLNGPPSTRHIKIVGPS